MDEYGASELINEWTEDPVACALDRVWCAASDFLSSPDFRDADGELDEVALIRYKTNVIRKAREELDLAFGGVRRG